MRILITGGSGFVGRNVYEYLLERGYNVDAPTSSELDCLDEKSVMEWLQQKAYDIVLHFAVYGNSRDKSKDPNKITEYNLRIFLNFYNHSKLYGRMFYSGSGAEYDKRYPICKVTEDEIGSSIPVDSYGVMKYTINQLIEKSDNIYNLRLFGIYGKYEYYPVKYISNMCCKAIKNVALTMRQNVYFDYLWIDDFCVMIERFIKKDLKYHSYNMVSGEAISLMDICNIINSKSGKDLPIHVCKEGFANEYTANNKRFLEECPDFIYTSHNEAIGQLYDWYKLNEEQIQLSHLLY